MREHAVSDNPVALAIALIKEREGNPAANLLSEIMDQHQDYEDRRNSVRRLLATQLGAHPDDTDRFGSGSFVCAAEYGEQGQKGDVVWYVMRHDEPLRRRRRMTFEWRAYTPEKIADAFVRAYEDLASPA